MELSMSMFATPADYWKARAELAEKDAERYRWLREQDWFSGPLCVVRNPKLAIKLGHDAPSRVRLDEAIDAAMADPAAGGL